MFKKIMGKLKQEEQEEEYLELDMGEHDPQDKILIQVEKLDNLLDAQRIQTKIREGKVLFVKIKEFRERDVNELKRALEKVKKTCLAVEGDIAGIGEDWVICTPKKAKIHREPEQQE